MTNDSTKTKERQVEKTNPIPWKELAETRVYLTPQGRFAQATYLSALPQGGKGRLQAMSETKEQKDLRRAFKRLKGIIRANFGYDVEREAFITLTYRGVMKDTEKLQADLEYWIKLVRKHYPDHKLEYVAVMEPHGHGGWHIHLLMKSDLPMWHGGNRVLGISYRKTRELWRQANGTGEGAVRHERLDGINDLGKYFEMYFVTEIPEDIENSGDKNAIRSAAKSAVKGSRLRHYPTGFKFYRTSRGIIRPKTRTEFLGDIVAEYGIPKQMAGYAIIADEDDNSPEKKRVQYIQTMEFKKMREQEMMEKYGRG